MNNINLVFVLGQALRHVGDRVRDGRVRGGHVRGDRVRGFHNLGPLCGGDLDCCIQILVLVLELNFVVPLKIKLDFIRN